MNSRIDFGLRESDLQDICFILEKFSQIEKTLIFGSRAKGNFKKWSDVDLSIIGKEITNELVAEINYFLNEETYLPYKFDVIHYEKVKNIDLKEHIDRMGIVFYEKLK